MGQKQIASAFRDSLKLHMSISCDVWNAGIPMLSKMLIQKHHISGLHQCRKKQDVSPTLCKFFCQVCDHFDLHQFSCKCMQRFHNGFVIHWVCFYFLPSFKNVFCLLVIFINILAIAFNQYVNVCFCILHACLAHTLAFIICLLSQIFFWFFVHMYIL